MRSKNCKILILLCCLLGSCQKDKPAAINNTTTNQTTGVYIVCEGQFQAANASLYLYTPVNDSVYGDLYAAANGQSTMGDVFQCLAPVGNQLFLSINNSRKVAVINSANYTLITKIPIPYPRYILQVSNTKAYISTLYDNKIYIVNTATFSVTDSIALPTMNPEGMLLYNGTAYVTSWDTATKNVYAIDVVSDKITQTIPAAGYAPSAVLQDKEGNLWVIAGNEPDGKTATLSRIDPSTGEVLNAYTFPAAANPIKPVFNPTKDTIYFIEANYSGTTANNGIYRMGIHDAALPVQPFIPAKQYQYFYALGIDPSSGNIYVGDPKGFTQKGDVYIYKSNGSLVTSFSAGIGPGSFYFK